MTNMSVLAVIQNQLFGFFVQLVVIKTKYFRGSERCNKRLLQLNFTICSYLSLSLIRLHAGHP